MRAKAGASAGASKKFFAASRAFHKTVIIWFVIVVVKHWIVLPYNTFTW